MSLNQNKMSPQIIPNYKVGSTNIFITKPFLILHCWSIVAGAIMGLNSKTNIGQYTKQQPQE